MKFPAVRFFCTCWLIFSVHWAPFVIREQLPAVTLATDGTLNVERFIGWTPDIFRGPRGGAFINNNPGASLVGAIPLVIARPALEALARWNETLPASRALAAEPRFAQSVPVRAHREWYATAVAFLTSAGFMAPVSACAATALALWLFTAGLSIGDAATVAFVFAFGTPVFVRTGYLNHNLLVCHAGLFVGMLLWSPTRRPLLPGRAAAAGVLAGFAVLCDYSGVILLAVAGVYAWLRAGDRGAKYQARVRVALAYAAGAVPGLLALAAYQHWAFGHSALPSQQFMTAVPETSHGYRGMDWPSLQLAWMNFFDPRFGIFVVCPLLFLGLAAPFVSRSRRRVPDREMWTILAFVGAFTVFCAANQYSSLQWSTGIRYLVPTIPWLVILSLQVVELMPRAIAAGLLIIDIAMSWLAAVTHAPLRDVVAHPGDLQLSWVHRFAEYEAIDHPRLITGLVLAVTVAALVTIWRKELRFWARHPLVNR